MTEKPSVIQCTYKSHDQFRHHAVLMMNTGYEVHAVNGRRPSRAMDRTAVRDVSLHDIRRLFGDTILPNGVVSVTYRLAGS